MDTSSIEQVSTPQHKLESRLATHDARMDFLDGLAILVGCTESLHYGLPDGKRPDVLRCNIGRGMLFIGDAKHTESPGCTASQGRLSEYLKWLAVQVSKDGRTGIFALCFSKKRDTQGWINIVLELSKEVGITFMEHGFECFTTNMNVAWFLSRKARPRVDRISKISIT